jgi:hypothetical protein
MASAAVITTDISRFVREGTRMGFMKDMKSSTASKDAARACAEGRQVFVFKFDMPNLNSGVTASVSGAAEAIEAIEREGWFLGHMSVHPSVRHGAMVMVFRRGVTGVHPATPAIS